MQWFGYCYLLYIMLKCPSVSIISDLFPMVCFCPLKCCHAPLSYLTHPVWLYLLFSMWLNLYHCLIFDFWLGNLKTCCKILPIRPFTSKLNMSKTELIIFWQSVYLLILLKCVLVLKNSGLNCWNNYFQISFPCSQCSI